MNQKINYASSFGGLSGKMWRVPGMLMLPVIWGQFGGRLSGPLYDLPLAYKGVAMAMIVLLLFFIIFFFAYKTLLERARKVYPRTLYGRCAAVFWILVTAVSLGLFHRELQFPPANTFWKAYGGWTLVGSIGMALALAFLYAFRSSHRANRQLG